MLRPLFLFLIMACAQRADVITQTQDPSQNERYLASLSGAYSISVEFPPAQSELSELSKEHLKELAERARQDGREIDKVKILAWADQEYPESSHKAHPEQVILAGERAHAIKEYLAEDLSPGTSYNSFNMAKRPGLFSQIVKGDEYEIKQAVEELGPTATPREDGSLSYSQASKAVIIIDYKDN